MDFGWNLMRFNPYCRWNCTVWPAAKTIVICRPGEEYIWEFADEFDFVEPNYSTNRWWHYGKYLDIPWKLRRKHGVRLRESGNRIIVPNHRNCVQLKRMNKFRKLGKKKPGGFDMVIHARATVKYGSRYRNWPLGGYGEMLDRLPGLKACSIGKQAHHVPGTEDMRELPLNELCDLMASSRFFFGPASGPAYLANLCHLPAFIWGDERKFDKARYRWRPFKEVPMRFVRKYGWNPEPSLLNLELKQFLIKINQTDLLL